MENTRDFADEVYGLRVLVLMECEDHFHQVRLTPEQFKDISGRINCPKHITLPLPIPERPDVEEKMLHVSDDWQIDADLFLGLEDFYDDVCDEKDAA